tara:strand:+ start:1251 stop:3365 length:2115 start_codon:yes stop_codon:yes gene_type:complete
MKLISNKKKEYSLTFLEGVVSHDILRVIKDNKHRVIAGAERTVYERIQGLEKWAEFLLKSQDQAASYLRLFKHGDTPRANDWVIHKLKLHQNFEKEFPSKFTRAKHISAVNFWLYFFADFAITPRTQGLPLPNNLTGENDDVRPQSKKKSVIDAECKTDIPEQFKDAITDYISLIAIEDPDREEKISLLINSVKEISNGNGDIDEISVESFPKLVEEGLARRLVRIRELAEKTFTMALNQRLKSVEYAKQGEDNYPQIIQWLDWEKGKDSGNSNPHWEAINKLTDAQVEQALLYCVINKDSEYYGVGFRYSSLKSSKYNRLRKFLRKRCIKFDAEDVINKVGASKELLISAQIILVDELDANPSPVRSISRNGVVKIGADLLKTSFIKARAGYKKLGLIELALTLSGSDKWRSAHDTISLVKDATEAYLQSCIQRDRDNLFIYNYQNSTSSNKLDTGDKLVVSTPSDNWFNENTQSLLSSIGEGLTANSIRQSRILLEGLQNGLLSAQAKGRHVTALVTNAHYLDKIAYAQKLERKMREFIQWLEALIVVDIEDYAKKVGYDDTKFASLKQKVIDDGFGGIVCEDPNAGYQAGTEKGDGCGLFLKCLTCHQRSSVFFANKQNVTQMILWSRAIKDHLLQIDNEEKADFIQWCYFIDTLYSELQQDIAYKAVLLESENEADALIAKHANPYSFVLNDNDNEKKAC